jgi:hypothetical protein
MQIRSTDTDRTTPNRTRFDVANAKNDRSIGSERLLVHGIPAKPIAYMPTRIEMTWAGEGHTSRPLNHPR